MSLYFKINILSILVPFLVSFHPRIKMYKSWKSILLAILLSMIPYIIWDVYFTQEGYWGFNEMYLSGTKIFDLPVEEWLFFICIPYACIFTHVSLLELNPKFTLKEKLTNQISLGLFILFTTIFITYFDRWYTKIDMIFALLILIAAHLYDRTLLRSYYITFLFMLIPFFIVNGILTGTGITDEIVWYNDTQNIGLRMLTIPIEDTAYAFSLLLLNLLIYRRLNTFFGN